MPCIELDRRFREPADEELEDVGPFGFVNSHDLLPGVFGWPKLLTYRRVILLAEAGSGKTEEMTQQKKKLVEAGKFALFIPLESLNSERLNECLSPKDERKFETWKPDGQMPGWFFLDALDELKLTEGKFRRTLNRLSRAIDGHLHRAHVIISCRPSDWRREEDLYALAWRIRDKAKGAYRVTREEEVADQKRPDIRLWTINKDHKAAVEVKIADKYSLNELEKALRDQLAGQYLRPSYCKAGCLLLTYHGRKLYWQCPKTGKRLSFSEGVA